MRSVIRQTQTAAAVAAAVQWDLINYHNVTDGRDDGCGKRSVIERVSAPLEASGVEWSSLTLTPPRNLTMQSCNLLRWCRTDLLFSFMANSRGRVQPFCLNVVGTVSRVSRRFCRTRIILHFSLALLRDLK